MPRGGARTNSGPPPDPSSARSDRRGLEQQRIPREAYSGEVPPLSKHFPNATHRAREVWDELWTMPQAHVWAIEPWRWPVVADLAKYVTRTELKDAPAALAPVVMRLREECLLTDAGMKRQGWAWAADEVAERRGSKAAAPPKPKSSRGRMRVVGGSSDG